jgi:hypothetical protein
MRRDAGDQILDRLVERAAAESVPETSETK